MPGIRIGKTTDPFAEVVDDIDAVEDVKHPPRAVHVPRGAKSQSSVGIMPGCDGGATVVRVVLGDQVFAGKVLAKRPDDLGNGAGIDGLHRVEAKSVDTIIA